MRRDVAWQPRGFALPPIWIELGSNFSETEQVLPALGNLILAVRNNQFRTHQRDAAVNGQFSRYFAGGSLRGGNSTGFAVLDFD